MEKKVIVSPDLPKVIGPYSTAIRAQASGEGGGFVFISGQLGLDQVTGNLVSGGIESETRQALTNLKNVLEASGSSLRMVVKATVFLMDMNDFPKMNAVYAEFFSDEPPARSTIQVAALPKGGVVEIEAIAITYDR